MTGPTERLIENITSATALVVIGIGILGYALGVPYFWVILAVGLLVVVPLVGLLFGAEDWRRWDPLSDEFWEDLFGESDGERTADTTGYAVSDADADRARDRSQAPAEFDAVAVLRDRYARGELTDDQFERKLQLLLETETLEDIEDRFGNGQGSSDWLSENE